MACGASSKRSWLEPTLWTVAACAALIALLWLNATAREVGAQTALALLQFFTTPFVLEISLAIIGLGIVLAINHLRMRREGDEWVYLQKTDVPAATSDGAELPPHRLDAVVWADKPMPFDQAGTALSVVEGFLAMGMPGEAARSLDESLAGEAPDATLLAKAALSIGEWHSQNGGDPNEVRAWVQRAVTLHPQCLESLAPGDPLRRLASN